MLKKLFADEWNVVNRTVMIFIIILMSGGIVFGVWFKPILSVEESLQADIIPVPVISFSDYDEYGGQMEYGNTNMIYAEIELYDGSTKHLVRVNKADKFSFEREFPDRALAVDYMKRYEMYLRSK